MSETYLLRVFTADVKAHLRRAQLEQEMARHVDQALRHEADT